ncbi:hypothetical protein HDR63_02895 [bacterium]|nr:hypothetical protein [bacterium]
MDKKLWVNLSKTVVMSAILGACASAVGDAVAGGHLRTFWSTFALLAPFNYWLFYKRGVTWRKSLERGAAEFDGMRDTISRWFNDRNNGRMAGA